MQKELAASCSLKSPWHVIQPCGRSLLPASLPQYRVIFAGLVYEHFVIYGMILAEVKMARGKVAQVIDGDTIRLKGGETVRIANLDAPELSQKGGQAAKRKLQKLLPRGKGVGLSGVLRQSYDRKVRKVTIKGQSINKLLTKPQPRKRK